MQSTKRISRALPLKRLITHTHTPKLSTRKMSFFPLSAYPSSTASSFSPLFRLLDDFEQHQSGNAPSSGHRHGLGLRSFTPKFDVKELANSYELHGELPGIEQKDVDIEFTDAQTLVVKGRTEKSYTRGTPPAGFIEEGEKQAQLTEGENHHVTPHKASVEDANDEAEEGSTSVTKSEGKKDVASKKEEKTEEAKYWISERSIGEFSRTFTFPGRVDQDGVKASMKNGILSIVVPKSKKSEGRKISIQ